MREKGRYCLTVVNGLFMVAGLTGVVVGILLHYSPSVAASPAFRTTLQHFSLQAAPPPLGNGLALTGAVCVCVSFIGCLGALCNLRAFLLLYSVLLLLIFSLQVSSAILITASDVTNKTYLQHSLEALIQDYDENTETGGVASPTPVRLVFAVFRCCGVRGPQDFNSWLFHWVRNPRLRPPGSPSPFPLPCCRDLDPPGSEVMLPNGSFSSCLGNVTADNAFLQGCLSVLQSLILLFGNDLIMIGACSVLLEVLMIALASKQCTRVNYDLVLEQTNIYLDPKNQGAKVISSPPSEKEDMTFSDVTPAKSPARLARVTLTEGRPRTGDAKVTTSSRCESRVESCPRHSSTRGNNI